ncbi:FBX48-like protein [Mya arenaria]|uniref:FBX48-like protein n=1 Tax=Mya arenaria TaxID=6604 RepID=A0ABY7FDP5_MYAAR|nr:F-box only protein 48-like [Mya arenaria]XP_052770120.1 F-box only protein 48-like [Mya arenaria]WAR18979.1 FBX48-like protein [Mya arenaria]
MSHLSNEVSHPEVISLVDHSSPITCLPTETLTEIFQHLPCREIVQCSQTCQRWHKIIQHSDAIWRRLCRSLTDFQQDIEIDRLRGYTWRATFQRYYGANGVKLLWRQGVFSNILTYDQLPASGFCHLDTASWGQILQWELERS